ncbi:MAG: thioredoxin family protein [Spirochaetales bacterium]|uniref:Thioredoxin family protein n=1 Tax=Candidatus Thalassospirochaeta sargassi TaxID=3119039 RepID=A0AAJ1IB26_9SPIO|nr:thioredoxin family protein [Spirochaetales bacterium]
MRNLLKIMAILSILTLFGCEKKIEADASQADEEKSSERAAVTFIELGSVSCIPCKMMQPIMEQVEVDFGEQVEVIFHDVWTDEGAPFASEYGIQAIPTQVFLDSDGREYYRHVGFFSQEELYEIIEKGLSLD